MSESQITTEASLFRSWLVATSLGWLLGFVLVLVLAVLWGMIGPESQFTVGIGMGTGVGYMQARVAPVRTNRKPWLWTSIIGMGVPFVLWDLSSLVGMTTFLSLTVCVLVGGLITGILQERLLRPEFERTFWWIPANAVGWGLPAALIALGDSSLLPAVSGPLAVLVMFSGGLLLGAVTGKTLEWIPRR